MNIQDGERRRNPQLLKLDGSLTSVYGATAEYPPPPPTHTHTLTQNESCREHLFIQSQTRNCQKAILLLIT